MKSRAFQQVDVFSATPYLGNPVAVILDGSGLSDADMQRFAAWTNLAETTFVLPPSADGAAAGADYQLRIFTPAAELPFAGHPTLGSCHAWLHAGGAPKSQEEIVQECGVGLVRIRREGGRLAFAAPPLRRSQPSAPLLAKVVAALGLQTQQIMAAQLLDNGPVWLGLLLDSPHTVLQLRPDYAALKGLIPGAGVGVAGVEAAQQTPLLITRSNREARAFGAHAADTLTPVPDTPELEVRCFADDLIVSEDPVTGSFNASVAQWLMAEHLAPLRYLAAQGTCLGRAGRVHLEQDASGQVWVGGEALTCIAGQVRL